MFLRIGLTICYIIAIAYILSVLLPAEYCLSHGCHGPELDGFMPAFMLTPIGAVATAFTLHNCIQNIKRGSQPWLFWPLAIVFAIVLLGVVALVVLFVVETVLHR